MSKKTFHFSDGFEDVDDVAELIGEDRWNTYELDRGELSLSHEIARSGTTALYAEADPNIGKADLVKTGMWCQEGDVVETSAWFWFPETGSLDKLYLMDVESKSAWANDGNNPLLGVRLATFGYDGGIAVERGKIKAGEPFPSEPGFSMPRGEWVKIDWEVKLGLADEGFTKVRVNNRVVIAESGSTYLDPAIAAKNGVKLHDDYAYDRVQIGLSANSSPDRIGLYIDDVEIAASSKKEDGTTDRTSPRRWWKSLFWRLFR